MGKRASTRGAKRPVTAIYSQYAAGATLEELEKKYGIKGKSQLATAVLDALIKEKKLPPLARRGRKASGRPKEFKVGVNRRGTIILPKEAVVNAFRAKEGEAFTVRRRGRKIILTKA